MAIEAAANCWTSVEDATAAALPQCAAFRAFVGQATAAAAAEFVFLEELGESPSGRTWSAEDLAEIAHYAIVTSSPEKPYALDRVTPDAFATSGQIVIYLDRRIFDSDLQTQDDTRANRNQVDRRAKNWVGSILQELIAYWDANGGPYVMRAMVHEGPYHNHPDLREGEGHWQGAAIGFEWGVRAE